MTSQVFLPLLLTGSLLLSGCQKASAQDVGTAAAAYADAYADMFTDRDLEVGYDEQSAAHITLTGQTAESDSDAVTVDGGTVTIADEGTYILSGSLDDGMILIDAGDTDKIQLVLDGASVQSADCAALYVRQADKVFVTTAADTENTLANSEAFTQIDDNNIDGAIFSKCDLTLNGQGTLTISSPAGHGVVTKDDLAVTSGSYVVTAAGHGLSGKDSVRIAGGTFTLTTGKDGLQSDNPDDTEKGFVYLAGGDFTIDAQGDGYSASSWMYVDQITCTVTTGGGSANAEPHESDMMPGGGMGGMRGQGGEPPEGMEWPADGEMPQPGERPANGEMPEGMQPPTDGSFPEDMEPPADGQAATGAVPSTEDGTAAADAQTDETTEDTVSTKGFKAGTDLTVAGGAFTLDCVDDAFHSNGDLTFISGDASIQTGDDAFHADNALTVQSGTVNVAACYEGLEGLTVTVNGGDISIVASDDGINAAGGVDQSGVGTRQDQFAAQDGVCICITGGTLTIEAGGDGLDSNGDLMVSGGVVYVSTRPNGADSAIDYNGSADISGGTVIATGASSMAQNFGDGSTQGSILLTVDSQQAGSAVSVADSTGKVLASWTPTQGYNAVVISCAGLQADGTYTVTASDTTTEITLDGLLYGEGFGFGGGMGGGRGKMQQRPAQTDTQDTGAADQTATTA